MAEIEADIAAEANDPQAAEKRRQRIAAEERRVEYERRQRIDDDLRRLWQLRGERYAGCTLENFVADSPEKQQALANVAEFADDIGERIRNGENAVFFGPPGTGKDHLLAALMRRAVERSYSVAWYGGMSMFGAFRDNIGSEDSEARLVMRFTAPAVLAISDPLPPFGDLTPFQASKLFEIIDWRYSHRKSTWLTMNVKNGDEARQGLGAAIVDRLRHGALVVPCNWESYRSRPQ